MNRFLSESNGVPSLMRLAVLLIVAALTWCYTYTTIKSGQMAHFSAEDMGVIALALGAKAWQKGKEKTDG